MKKRVVVLGGGYAGTACAYRLARKSAETEVVLVDVRPYFVERIRLHQDVAGPSVRRRTPLQKHVGDRVRVLTGLVDGVDLETRRVHVGGRSEAFDELVVATGSSSETPRHSVSIATQEEALVTRARIADSDVRRVIVVGGGLTGVEMAAELSFRRPDLALTIVSGSAITPGTNDFFARHRVEVIENRRVASRRKAASTTSSSSRRSTASSARSSRTDPVPSSPRSRSPSRTISSATCGSSTIPKSWDGSSLRLEGHGE